MCQTSLFDLTSFFLYVLSYSSILSNLREQMYRYRMEYLKDRSMHKNLLEEHDAIRRALKKHDKEKAGNAIHTHIENQKESIINSLREKE